MPDHPTSPEPGDASPPTGSVGPDPSGAQGSIRSLLEAMYRPEEARDQVLGILAESIEKAHDTNPSCWALTVDRGEDGDQLHLRLQVGRAFALSLDPETIAVTLVEDGPSAPTHPSGVTGEVAGAFKALPGVVWHRLDPEGLLEQWPELRSGHLDAVERAAQQVRRTAYFLFHDESAAAAVGSLAGRTPPEPEHGRVEPGRGEGRSPALTGLSGAKQKELRSLLGELLDDHLPSAEGQRALELYRRGRTEARRRFLRLLEVEERGEEVADAVFRGLLPHADTDENERLEAWIWPGAHAPADALGWLMETGAARPEDGPLLATAALDFVRHSVEDPSSLPDICRGFAALPYARGLDASLVTPFLSALRPEEFLAMDHRLRRVVGYLAGGAFGRELADYPRANGAGRELLERFGDELSIADDFGIEPADLLHLFAHWMTRVEQHPLGSARYWWVRAGGDGEEWRRALRAGFVGVDEGLALGDLSQLGRRDYDQRRDELGEHDDALWTFSREMAEGDRVVAVRGGRVAAVGTISGPYAFARAGASGHYLPVEWDDLQPRALAESPDPLPERVVEEIDRELFEVLRRRPAPVSEEEGGTEPATVPPPGTKSLAPGEEEAEKAPPDAQEASETASDEEPAEGPGAPGATAAEPAHGTVTTLHGFYSLERLAEATHLPEDELCEWIEIARHKGQLLLVGPPGTGKTFLARHLARHLVSGDEGVLRLLPLHPALGPGDLFAPGRGRFVDFCREAGARSGTSVLVLDGLHHLEPAALGPIPYLLQHRDEEVPLADGSLLLPASTLVLATWTLTPRRGAPGPALGRHFAQWRLSPRGDLVEAFLSAQGAWSGSLGALLEEINREIGDPRAALGVAPFLDPALAEAEDPAERLRQIWRSEVEPHLEWALADRPRALERYLWENLGWTSEGTREPSGQDPMTEETDD